MVICSVSFVKMVSLLRQFLKKGCAIFAANKGRCGIPPQATFEINWEMISLEKL